MVFMGRGFTSGGQESGSVFSASMCIIQASKRYVESLPLVLKDKRSCFSQGERLGRLVDIWKPSMAKPRRYKVLLMIKTRTGNADIQVFCFQLSLNLPWSFTKQKWV